MGTAYPVIEKSCFCVVVLSVYLTTEANSAWPPLCGQM